MLGATEEESVPTEECEGEVNADRLSLAELWSVTMVFVSKPSNAIVTLNSYC